LNGGFGYTNKAILPTTLQVSNGDPQEDKSTHISTTKVSYHLYHLDSVHSHDGVLCTPWCVCVHSHKYTPSSSHVSCCNLTGGMLSSSGEMHSPSQFHTHCCLCGEPSLDTSVFTEGHCGDPGRGKEGEGQGLCTCGIISIP